MEQPILDAIENTFLKAEQVFGRKFERCKVSFNARASSKAGTASVQREIKINLGLYHKNPTHILEDTCPHEVAHIIAFDLYGIKGWGHGPLWKKVMVQLGRPPVRCHNLVTPSSLPLPVYECQSCKKQGLSRIKLHRMYQNGYAKINNCRCGGDFVFVGRVADLIRNGTLTALKMPEK